MPRGRPQRVSSVSLKEEVRNALLAVLRDQSAPATARASAGRTLWEMGLAEEGQQPGNSKPPIEMSVEEIDAQIARIEGKQH